MTHDDIRNAIVSDDALLLEAWNSWCAENRPALLAALRSADSECSFAADMNVVACRAIGAAAAKRRAPPTSKERPS